jgi:hypothetical protein
MSRSYAGADLHFAQDTFIGTTVRSVNRRLAISKLQLVFRAAMDSLDAEA